MFLNIRSFSDSMAQSEEVLAEAKHIMDSFYEVLSKTDINSDSFGVYAKKQIRDAKPNQSSDEFKRKMLANAPHKDDESIIAETKHW